MKKQSGFTLVELLVATAVSSVVIGAAVMSFSDSVRSNTMVTQTTNMADNLRGGLNLIQQDLIQAGTGIITGGIPFPNNAAGVNPCSNTAPNRPGPKSIPAAPAATAALFFPSCHILPAIEPGFTLGPSMTPIDGGTASTTDVITLLYADNQSATGMFNRVAVDKVDCPLGTINATGTSVTFDPAAGCANLSPGNIQINVGDLIWFSNSNGNAIQTVTAVGGQTLTFAGGDPFGLNNTGRANGTLPLMRSGVVYPDETTATRVWMITYYLDPWTDPTHMRLMRQVNFNAPQPVSEIVEALNFTYDYINGTPTPLTSQTGVPVGYTEGQIRSVNITLGVRSDKLGPSAKKYLRNNLTTQVTIRSLAFFNKYN